MHIGACSDDRHRPIGPPPPRRPSPKDRTNRPRSCEVLCSPYADPDCPKSLVVTRFTGSCSRRFVVTRFIGSCSRRFVVTRFIGSCSREIRPDRMNAVITNHKSGHYEPPVNNPGQPASLQRRFPPLHPPGELNQPARGCFHALEYHPGETHRRGSGPMPGISGKTFAHNVLRQWPQDCGPRPVVAATEWPQFRAALPSAFTVSGQGDSGLPIADSLSGPPKGFNPLPLPSTGPWR
jgi:hypothetical protein